MKNAISILILILPIFVIAQNEISPLKNGVGISLSYSGFHGLTTDIRYDRYTESGFIFRTSIYSNASYRHGIKLGLHKNILSTQKIDLSIGFDAKYRHYSNLDKLGLSESSFKPSNLGFEIPLELRYHITPNLDINLGAWISSREELYYSFSNNYGFNIGLTRRF